jgi:hypothetical protein
LIAHRSLLRLSLVAPSGSGKSSTANFMVERCDERGLRARIIKLAEPLYAIQQHFYRVARIEIDRFAQNQRLLEDIARHLRSIRPDVLVQDFLSRLDCDDADVVINDDLRDMETDLPLLRRAGFVTVRISAVPEAIERRLVQRRDLQTQRNSRLDAPLLAVTPDHVLVNDGDDLKNYRRRVHAFIDLMLAERSLGCASAAFPMQEVSA